jgi:hypothetical protein
MSKLVPFAQVGGEMPTVSLDSGEIISALEFFQAVHAQAPLALQHESWLRLAKMAFVENRMDCLQLAKQQAVQIQRQGMGGELTGMPMPMPMSMPQQYPTTYYHPQPQPIIFSPQITVNPTIAPTFQNTNTASPTNTHATTRQQTTNPYSYDEPSYNIATWIGMFFATAALVILFLG